LITAIYPGSFDPVTNGHLDIIKRSSKMFDKVIVVVARNYSKPNICFSDARRVEFLRRSTAGIKNVEIDVSGGLTAEYAKRHDAVAIVKGLRAVSDFDTEFQQALMNKKLNPELETVFITASAEYMFLSSSLVKQLCELGGDITEFVPKEIYEDVVKGIKKNT